MVKINKNGSGFESLLGIHIEDFEEIIINGRSSNLWIELGISKLTDALWNQNYSKTEKSIEQLLNSDLKGI